MVAVNNDNDYLKGYITLEEVLNQYLSENDMFGNENKFRLMDILIRGAVKIFPHNSNNTRVQYLTPNSINCATLPNDYMMYIKVAIDVNGRIWTISYNPNIVLPREEECGARIRDIDESNANVSDKIVFIPHYYNGTYIDKLYGLRGGYNVGYFRIDRENWLIVLEGDLAQYASKIFMEYVGTGIKMDGTTTIPIYGLEVLLAWMDWRVKRSNKGKYNQYEIVDAENQYGIELDEYRRVEHRLTYVDYVDEFYLNSSQTVKRL